MGVHVDRLDNGVRQCVSVDSTEGDVAAGVIAISYFTPTRAIEVGRRMVELGEELLREQASQRSVLDELADSRVMRGG